MSDYKFKYVGFNIDNTYENISDSLFVKVKPDFIKNPKLILFNKSLAEKLNLNFKKISEFDKSAMLSGNFYTMKTNTIAQSYAGHQFGFFTNLGDGRAALIGEHVYKNKRYDIQLKGSGRTPYSRNGDGKATLVSMLREYLISEAMHGLGIPTTRSLSVVETDENIRREKIYKGGILTRIASSHIRVGTFQYLSMRENNIALDKLINYSLDRHFPNYLLDTNPAITLLKLFMDRQISLIVNWMRVGFIHGVMNTDNMTISGETIDYGPCAFMNTYNPNTVFSSIDENGRYSFKNQSLVAHWNISRFAETLIPFLNSSRDKAIEIGKEIINSYEIIFKIKWLNMMKKKLGFYGENKDDLNLINELLNWMEINNADYTNTFVHLMNKKIKNKKYYENSFNKIKNKINQRLDLNDIYKDNIKKIISENNPLVIPRNHLVEEALFNIDSKNDYSLFNNLLKITKKPYTEKKEINKFQKEPDIYFDKNYKTYCGT